ncbi:MAG: hypothetical protein H8E27_14720 [Verrucomicrobia subdivision 3 bacterium]|nr:hypothetical protein [Limisphaerales bacterium]
MSDGNLTVQRFLAVIKGVCEKTRHPMPPHLTPLAEGHAIPAPSSLEEALKTAGLALDDAQSACLFANIVNLSIADGRVRDRSLVELAAETLRLERDSARDVQEALEARFQSNAFRDDDEWALFCAVLIAMEGADGEVAKSETAYLQRFVPSLEHIEAGNRLLAEKAETLDDQVARLSTRQKRFLTAHVIGMMLIDGQYEGTEAELLEKLTDQMSLAQCDQDRLLKGLYTLYNVSVLG